MHLKSITLKGFKSFPDRTRLEFAPGVSRDRRARTARASRTSPTRCCGRMGEQSPLAVRGQSMQDVIFAGGHGVQARSSAEVELVLDNADGALDLAAGRDLDPAPARSQRRGRVPPQRRALPAGRRARGALRHRPGQGDALGRLAGPRRGDRHLQAARPPPADRGGRRPRQAPQAPPPRAAQARAHAGEPRPRARRRARGALAAAPAQAPGRGGRAARAPRAPDARGALGAVARRRARAARRAGGRRGRRPAPRARCATAPQDGARGDRRAPRARRGGARRAHRAPRGARRAAASARRTAADRIELRLERTRETGADDRRARSSAARTSSPCCAAQARPTPRTTPARERDRRARGRARAPRRRAREASSSASSRR